MESVSCVQQLSSFLSRKRLVLNSGTNFNKIADPVVYSAQLLNIASMIITALIMQILRSIPYYDITISGNTVYSRVAAAAIKRTTSSYVLCRGPSRLNYYETDNNKLIPFEGPSSLSFDMSQPVSFIAMPSSDIKALEQHTKVTGLEDIQKEVLCDKNIMADLINTENVKAPIMCLKQIYGLYYVKTCNESWLSRKIITDVAPLQPAEVVVGTTAETTAISRSEIITNVTTYDKDVCTVINDTGVTLLQRHECYEVGQDLTVKCIKECNNESIIYHLKHPRPFRYQGQNICFIHPFHMPATWDAFLAIIVLSIAYARPTFTFL